MKDAKKQEDITAQRIYKEYNAGLGYNSQINLEDTVKVNENFFIGKQWEGVVSNGLPTPQINILKRGILFQVASITADNITMQTSPMSNYIDKKAVQMAADIINSEFGVLFETNSVAAIMREYARNAAVDGDGCTYTYWDDSIETGQEVKGAIVTEVIDNTRIYFGNPSDRRVQKQPYIIIARREMTDEVRKKAEENGITDADLIASDTDDTNSDLENLTDNKTTVLLRLWRNRKTKTIWACASTKSFIIRKPWDLGLSLYPITWLNWDYVKDSYHGMAMITGLIPNQEFINKTYAMSQLSIMTSAFPKIVYDKTKIKKWDNRVGSAIGVNGGDVSGVAKIIDPAQISPQIAQFIERTISDTQNSMGATAAALGDTRPDNTSAIVALQRAAAVPAELTKQNLYKSIEDLGRIYIDFMGEYYGTRTVEINIPQEYAQAAQYAGVPQNTKVPVEFDFSSLKDMNFILKLDVGASSYWAEIATIQTIENLLMQGKISTVQFLERMPDSYITKRQELIDELKADEEAAKMQAMGQMITPPDGQNMQTPAQNAKPPDITGTSNTPTEIPTGGGYGELQRAINRGALVK